LAFNYSLHTVTTQYGVDVVLDILGLAFLDHQDRFLAGTELYDLIVDQRVGDIEHVQWYAGVAITIGHAQAFHGANKRIVNTALDDQANTIILAFTSKEFVEFMLSDVLNRLRPALVYFFLLMDKT